MRRSSSLRFSGWPTAASAISNGVFGASFKPFHSNLRGRLCLEVGFRKPPQRGAIDLVGRGERQLVDEPDEARMLVRGRVGKRETLDHVLADARARLPDH